MTRETFNTLQRSSIRNRFQHILFPVVCSLMIALNAQGQTKPDSNATSQTYPLAEMEFVQDSTFIADIESILNTISIPRLPQSTREKLIKDLLIKIEFFSSIPQERIYMKRKNGFPLQASMFLNSFYKESYRESGTLFIDVSNISLESNKLYIHFDYIYTPKEN